MKENEQISSDYLKGFNQGYLLAKHEPELAEQMSKALPNTELGKGFKSGREEFLNELKKDKLPGWLQKNRISSLEKKEDKDLDKEL